MLGITEALGIGLKIIDKFIPDPELKAKAKTELLTMDLTEFKEIVQSDIAQSKVNAVEAESESLFKSGWRPAVGWTCVAGLIYTFILRPFLIFTLNILAVYYQIQIDQLPVLPSLDINELMTLLFGLLGLGAYRSYDKKQTVNR